MAPLTWRNVDAPSFSGPNEIWKLAATLMNQGFDSARRGINDFRDITTEEQSAALMQQVIGAGNDPAAIQAAVAGGIRPSRGNRPVARLVVRVGACVQPWRNFSTRIVADRPKVMMLATIIGHECSTIP